MVCTVLMCCALLGAERGGDAGSSASTRADLSVYEAAKSKAGKSARRPRSAGSLVRGARPDGRAGQAPVPCGPLRSLERAGTWADGPGRPPRQMGTARSGRREDSERSGPTGLDPRVPGAPRHAGPQAGRPVEARGLVRPEWFEGASPGSLQRDDPARSSRKKTPGDIWVTKNKGAVGSSPRRRRARRREAEQQKRPTSNGSRGCSGCGTAWKARTRRGEPRPEQELAEVTDPRAVPMIWAVFVSRNERSQLAADPDAGSD